MCGIAGLVLSRPRSLPDAPRCLLTMRDAMTHRGPDDADVFLSRNGAAGLVNCRLAIRDLSPAGRMPMATADGTIQITHNGEIYNADELRADLEARSCTFRSRSDTEVILKGYEAWGDVVVERLRGMFAFAILDLRGASAGRGRLLLARDRLGIKPLYYAGTPDAFLFASELKGLVASGLLDREINPVGLVGYLLLGSVPSPHTIHEVVWALDPATVLTVDLASVSSCPPSR